MEQVRQILRYTESKQLLLNFDADKAGTNAAERAIGEIAELAYKGEVQLKILNLPDGKDADEYLQGRNPEDYRELLANAPLWLDWQIQQISQRP
jgi:DNA primase